MHYLRKNKIYFALLMILILIVSMLPSAYAASGTKTESESNNSFGTATVTYDDYDNTGYLSTLSDVDYWCVTFSQDGYANYWLKAPTGCDFDLYLYDSSGTLLEAGDKDAANYQEKIRYNVTAGE